MRFVRRLRLLGRTRGGTRDRRRGRDSAFHESDGGMHMGGRRFCRWSVNVGGADNDRRTSCVKEEKKYGESTETSVTVTSC